MKLCNYLADDLHGGFVDLESGETFGQQDDDGTDDSDHSDDEEEEDDDADDDGSGEEEDGTGSDTGLLNFAFPALTVLIRWLSGLVVRTSFSRLSVAGSNPSCDTAWLLLR